MAAGLALILAAVTAAVIERHKNSRLTETASARAAVSRRAAEFSQALLSYDRTNIAAGRDRVLAMSTGDFARTYSTAFNSGLEALITKLQATAKATAREVYVTEASGGEARAIAVVDSKVTSTAGIRDLTGSYVQMDLVKEKGIWKIRGATAIGSDQDGMTPGVPDGKNAKPGTGK